MFLIAQNKIIAHIELHPELSVSLTLWLLETTSKKSYFFSAPTLPNDQPSIGVGIVDCENCVVEYEINYAANAVLIIWVGTKAEYQQKKEIAEKLSIEDAKKRNVKRFTLNISFTAKSTKLPKHDLAKPTYNANLQDKIAYFNLGWQLSDVDVFYSVEEYELGITNVMSLFKANSGSSDFSKLMLLLFKIDQYERSMLRFPKVSDEALIESRLKLFQLNTASFVSFLPQNEFELFLTGETKLKKAVLKRLFKYLALGFLLDR